MGEDGMKFEELKDQAVEMLDLDEDLKSMAKSFAKDYDFDKNKMKKLFKKVKKKYAEVLEDAAKKGLQKAGLSLTKEGVQKALDDYGIDLPFGFELSDFL